MQQLMFQDDQQFWFETLRNGEHERAARRTPTGTELDGVAGTNTYGRALLRQWRRSDRIPAAPEVSGTGTTS
jgi:hypothetical protein